MSSSHSILATIHCGVEHSALDRLIAPFGLHATAGEDAHEFLIVAGRHSEPEVNYELADLALGSLYAAQARGSIPQLAVTSSKVAPR